MIVHRLFESVGVAALVAGAALACGAEPIAQARPNVLVILADDLGYSSERDAGIFLCIAAGAVTRASLLVTGASARAALARAAALPRLEVALHLNLTEGAPLCGAEVPSLLAPGARVRVERD